MQQSSSSDQPDRFPIVYFGNDWFADNRTSSHHIARRLAAKYPMLYVESPGFRAPQATAADATKIWRKLRGTFERPRKVGEQMWHMIAPQIPFRHLPGSKIINRLSATYLVRRAMREIGMRGKPLVWYATPDLGDLAGHLNERFVVYYITDDHKSMPGVNAVEIAGLDERLTRKANQVFVTSPVMVESKRTINQTAEYSPHGVDVEHFQKAMDPDLPVAQGARGFRRPVIGFVGVIESWVDLKLVAHCALARPDWTFLMVGRVAVDTTALAHLPNVVFAGPKRYDDLPSWMKVFDACIIPFCDSELVMHINPLKLREYLASGRPVVSTFMPEVQKLHPLVKMSRNDYGAFLQHLEDAVLRDTDADREERLRAVSAMTWDARVTEALDVVRRRMAGSSGRHIPQPRLKPSPSEG
jgi:glycosyltransferase involved in cell wall biosynthesis